MIVQHDAEWIIDWIYFTDPEPFLAKKCSILASVIVYRLGFGDKIKRHLETIMLNASVSRESL